MREIKFRAWDHDTKRYFIPDELKYKNGRHVYLSVSTGECVIEQFTGLHDKNGKEIYEGDIGKDGSIVQWFDGLRYDSIGALHPGFYCKEWMTYDNELSWHYGFENFEIIGNIHETPELIKKDK